MSSYAASRLWPVLLVLVVLLAGAASLEVYVAKRDPRVIAMTIRAEDTAAASDEDTEDSASEVWLEKNTPVTARHAEAREAGRRGDPRKAIELLRAELAVQNSPQVSAELGYWLLLAEEPQAAAEELRRSASVSPDNPHTQLNLGVALRRAGDLQAARAALQRAVELKPGFGAARLALGILLLRMNDPKRAIEQLEVASSTGGNDSRARALVILGRAHLKAGNPQAAADVFDRAVEWAPALAEIRIGIARAYLSAGGKTERAIAIRELQQAADIAPDLPQPHSLLARAHSLAGDKASAKREFEATLALDPAYSYARRHLIRLALADQDLPRARMHAELLLQAEGEVPEHHFLAGLVAAQSERADEARQHYGRALEKAKGHYPEALFNLGILEKEQKKYPEAIAHYKQALLQKPDYVAAANNMGLVHVEAGALVEAEAAYQEALRIDNKYGAAWFNLGSLKLDQEKFGEAIVAFEQALKVNPGHRRAALNLGVAYRQAKRLDDAVATYRRLTEREPRYVRAWYNLGVALGFSGRYAEAKAAYDQALSLDEEHWPSLKNLAFTQQRLGQPEHARATCEAFLDHSPGDVDVRLALAGLLAMQGDAQGCSRQAELVLSGAPDNAEARRQLNDCQASR